MSVDQAKYYYKSYARDYFMPYPVFRERGKYEYTLMINGLPLKEIHRLLGRHRCSVSRAITKYCERNHLERPKATRIERAHFLSVVKGLSYSEIASRLGYTSEESCRISIAAYGRRLASKGL